ncbi:MAG: apolipoprotein N-acyltransferase [Planctomycetota bacterium]|jgi:apolipoprotein N-acyltransferase
MPGVRQIGLGFGLFLTLLHAVTFFLSFHPVMLWPLAFMTVAPLAVAVRDANKGWVAALLGFSGYFLHGALAILWLTLLGPAPWLGASLWIALWGLGFAAGIRAAAGVGCPSWLAIPIVWCALEILSGTLFFTAFPWVYLAHAVFPLPMIQGADLLGSTSISFVVALSSGLLVEAWDYLRARRSARRAQAAAPGIPRSLKLAALCFGALAIGLNAYGVWRPGTIELHDGPRVLAVQSNVPQDLKNTEQADVRLAQLVPLSRDHATLADNVDLVVWPETMTPSYWDPETQERLAVDRVPQLQALFAELSAVTGARFLVGSVHHGYKEDGTKVSHNSMFYLDRDGSVLGRYDKVFLAPMSEYAPFETLWPALHRWLRATLIPPGFNQFERGDSAALFEVDGTKVGGSVCFDIAFPEATRASVNAGAEVVINVSNYAWFQDSAELDLARVHTIFRAIETRRAMVCVVNAGITHFVDARGRVSDLASPDGRTKQIPGVMLRAMQTSKAKTLYLLVGDLFGWLLVVVLGAFLIAGGILRRRDRHKKVSAGPLA